MDDGDGTDGGEDADAVTAIDARTAGDLPEGGLEALAGLYRTYGWWDDRDPEDVRRAVEGTDLLVALYDGDRLVAAARVLTDFVYYARVYDVLVAPDRRGDGLGRRLLSEVVEHPALDRPGVSLLCREGLVPFYAACGLVPADEAVEHPGGPRSRSGGWSTGTSRGPVGTSPRPTDGATGHPRRGPWMRAAGPAGPPPRDAPARAPGQ